MILRLLRYIRGYDKPAIGAPLCVALEVVCALILPRLMSSIIDVGIDGDGGFPHILKMGGIMLLLSVLSMAAGLVSTRLSATASQGFGANLRKAMFDKVQDFSFTDIDRFSSASLITRLTNDVNAIQQMVGMALRMLVRAPLMFIIALINCATINPRLTLVLLAVVPVMACASYCLMKATRKLFTIFQQKVDGLNDSVQENLIAIRVVKAFVREAHEKGKFRQRNEALRDAAIRAVTRIQLLPAIMMMSFGFSIVGVLWVGGRLVMGGELMTGELYSFITYISAVLMSVMMLSFTLLQVTRARACAERINEVLDTEPNITDGTASELPAPTGRVEFRDVSFRYTAGTGDDVLAHIDLDIAPGQFVAIVGGTGVGKSSLVNLIPRFYDVTGGAVTVDGLDVRDWPVEALRSRIGMVLQNNVLFTGTIRENLLWGRPDATEEEMITAAKNAQAYDFIMSFPEGFDTMLEQGGVNVSGGQKQRLCIALAMLRHPEILILDDSTSAVDSATEAAIRQSFRDNLKGMTVIIIAQRISSVRYADKIVILEDDHIAGVGTHEELLASNPIYQEIYASQQEGVSA